MLDNMTLCVSLSLVIRVMRLTRYIISNSQFSHDVFSTPRRSVASGTRRNTTFFSWPKFPSTGTDKSFGSTINLAQLLVHIYIPCRVSAKVPLDRLISVPPRRNDARYVSSSILDDVSPLHSLPTFNVGYPPHPTYHPVARLSNIVTLSNLD